MKIEFQSIASDLFQWTWKCKVDEFEKLSELHVDGECEWKIPKQSQNELKKNWFVIAILE